MLFRSIARISLFFPAIDTVGRIDLVALYVLEVVMLFAIVINMQLAVHCICKCTGYENRAVISIAVNAVLFLILLFFDNKFSAIFTVWSKWMWIVFAVFANIIPLLAWTMRRRGRQ